MPRRIGFVGLALLEFGMFTILSSDAVACAVFNAGYNEALKFAVASLLLSAIVSIFYLPYLTFRYLKFNKIRKYHFKFLLGLASIVVISSSVIGYVLFQTHIQRGHQSSAFAAQDCA